MQLPYLSREETKTTDFSVVLFRSDFMLFSEKNRMKVHENQWVLTMPYPLERLAGATSRGQTMPPGGQKPSQWLCLAKFPREMYSQPIVHKALSWGAIRKSACILAEITIRKSQTILCCSILSPSLQTDDGHQKIQECDVAILVKIIQAVS